MRVVPPAIRCFHTAVAGVLLLIFLLIIMLHTLYQLIKHHGDGTQDNNGGDHHVELETAAYVIEDENYIEMYDFEHSIEEDRYIAICCV